MKCIYSPEYGTDSGLHISACAADTWNIFKSHCSFPPSRVLSEFYKPDLGWIHLFIIQGNNCDTLDKRMRKQCQRFGWSVEYKDIDWMSDTLSMTQQVTLTTIPWDQWWFFLRKGSPVTAGLATWERNKEDTKAVPQNTEYNNSTGVNISSKELDKGALWHLHQMFLTTIISIKNYKSEVEPLNYKKL